MHVVIAQDVIEDLENYPDVSMGLILIGEYNDGNLTINSINLSLTYFDLSPEIYRTNQFLKNGNNLNQNDLVDLYTYDLLGPNNDTLKSGEFIIPKLLYLSIVPICVLDEPCGYNDTIELSEIPVIIKVPYVPIGTRIVIKNSDQKILSDVNISKYSDYCGDGKCSSTESYVVCSKDCEDKEYNFNSDLNMIYAQQSVVKSKNEFVVYQKNNMCETLFEEKNCVEYYDEFVNVFTLSNTNSDIIFDPYSAYTINANDYSKINFVKYGEDKIVLDNNDFLIAFESISSYPSITLNYQSDGSDCKKIFDPSKLMPLVISCEVDS